MFRRYWRVETGLFLAIWLGLMIGGRGKLFRDPGTFWHTVVGERILTSGEFSDTDSFSYTFAGQHWIPHQWLGECIMGAMHRFDGLDSLLLATTTLLAGLYTWAASRLLRAGLHWSLTGLIVVLALGASASHFHIRPHLATMVFLAWTFATLADFEAGRIGCARLFWLVPVYLFWTNVHGGMLGGLCTIVLASGYWFLSWIMHKPSPIRSQTQVLLLGLLVALCASTAFLNPYGPRLPQTWVGIMDSTILPDIIIEHSPLKPGQPDGWMVLLLAGSYVFALAGLRPQWPKAAWLLPLFWLFQAWSRIRHAPLFALTALLALAEILPRTRWATWLAQPGRDLFQPPQSDQAGVPGDGLRAGIDWRGYLLPACVVVLALVLQARALRVPVVGHGWARLDADYWPVELLADLRAQAQAQPAGTPVFNEYLYGGFLIYYAPTFRVFVDDRCELYGDRWLLELVHAEWSDTRRHLEELQDRHGRYKLALTHTGSGFDRCFRSDTDWTELHRTDTATLYQRKLGGETRAGLGTDQSREGLDLPMP